MCRIFSKEEQLMWERKKVSSWGITSYDIHLDSGRILFPAGGSLYYCMDRGGAGVNGGCSPVFPYEIQTRTLGARLNATMCPHNPALVAFVNSGDIWVTHLDTRQEERLTYCHNAGAEGVAEDPASAGLPSYVMQVRLCDNQFRVHSLWYRYRYYYRYHTNQDNQSLLEHVVIRFIKLMSVTLRMLVSSVKAIW